MIKHNKQIFFVSFRYFDDQYMRNLKKPSCIPKELAEFLFNWSLETVRQFGKNILKTIPSKMYISKATELENLKQVDTADKVLKLFDIFETKKVDKFELICILPFIVESNFENAFFCKFLNKFLGCIEFFSFESNDKITRDEMYLLIDCLLRSIHKVVIIDDIDEIAEKTKKQLVRLHDTSLNEILNLIFDNNVNEIDHVNLVK